MSAPTINPLKERKMSYTGMSNGADLELDLANGTNKRTAWQVIV